MSLTEVSKLYYSRCKPLLEEFYEIENLIRDTHTSPIGELKISAPTNFSELHLMPVISDFTKQYPEIRINLQLSDSVVDIVDEAFDLALRIGVLPDSSLVAQRLASVKTVICATPTYLKDHGKPDHPEALLTHTYIVDMNYRGGKSWQFKYAGEIQNIKILGRHNVNSAVAVSELVLDNNGIALCPTFVFSNRLASGRLKIVLSDYEIESFGLHVVYSHRKHLSTKI